MTADSSGGRSTQERLLSELTGVMEPLAYAVRFAAEGNPNPLLALLSECGGGADDPAEVVDTVETELSDVADAWTVIDEAIVDPLADGESPSVADLDDVLAALDDCYGAVTSLRSISVPGDEIDDLGERLLHALVASHLEERHPRTFETLVLCGIVSVEGAPEIAFDRIADLLSNPNESAAEALDWGREAFDPVLLLEYLHGLLTDRNVPASLGPAGDFLENLLDDPTVLDDPASMVSSPVDPSSMWAGATIPQALTVPILSVENDAGFASAGVAVVHLPGEGDALPGLALVPFGSLAAEETIDLGSGWSFNVDVTGESADWGVTFRPGDDGVEADVVSLGDGDSVPTEAVADASVEYDATAGDDADELLLLGEPDAGRLAVRSMSVRATVAVDGDDVTVRIALPTRGTLSVAPDSFDGFLASVLPDEGIRYDFATTIGWSSSEGLFLENGGALEASLPERGSLGPIDLSEIYLAALADDEGDIVITGAASATLELGPIVGTVERMGVEARVAFPDDRDGEFGIVDLDLGFKPPEGVGIAIDAEGVEGGGYLYADEENDRYAGAVQIQVGEIGLDAVGLLTTRLPGGEDGFSFLVVVAGDIPPIQLPLGFNIDAVGGLLGVNRAMKRDPLVDAVRTGSLDSVLFPEDPVENADRIISDLRRIFPPREDEHVFGPMVRIGWGTPPLITADLGVVLEIPSARVSLLGRVSAALPDPDEAALVLNMNVLGQIDPEKQEIAFDASLVDSFVGPIDLEGDAALRLGWGDNSRFLLSIGGFHPKYDPPDDVGDLRRVRATMGPPGGNPSIELTGYFALTTNTVQAGADLSLEAKAGPAKVSGGMGFDALIEFDPFGFEVGFYASLSVTVKGTGFSVDVDGTIWGTSPWRVRGKVTVEVLFISFSGTVDETFGEETGFDELPSAEILPELLEAIEAPANWSARPVKRVASRRETEADRDDEVVLLHPLGALSVSQTTVPLEEEIELFGNARPGGYTRFALGEATLVPADEDDGEGSDGDGETDRETETLAAAALEAEFAPAQFFEMSDEEKLDAPSFEELLAGAEFTVAEPYLGGDSDRQRLENAREEDLTYDTWIRDVTEGHRRTLLSEMGRYADAGEDATPAERGLIAPAPAVVRAFDSIGAVAAKRSRLERAKRVSARERTVDRAAKERSVGDRVAKERSVSDRTAKGHRSGDGKTEGRTAETATSKGRSIESRTVETGAVAGSGAARSIAAERVATTIGDDRGGSGDGGDADRSSARADRAAIDPETSRLTGRLSVSGGEYVVVDAADMTPADLGDERVGATSKRKARRALSRYRAKNPGRGARYRVVEAHRARVDAAERRTSGEATTEEDE